MFGEAGHAYIYFTYGFHYCLNFVTSSRYGKASAVLIRAAEPVAGIEEMEIRRKTNLVTDLANGPGKLGQAFLIDKSLNGVDLTRSDSPIRVEDILLKVRIAVSSRVGIKRATERMWRFYSKTSPYVSKSRPSGHWTGKLIYRYSDTMVQPAIACGLDLVSFRTQKSNRMSPSY